MEQVGRAALHHLVQAALRHHDGVDATPVQLPVGRFRIRPPFAGQHCVPADAAALPSGPFFYVTELYGSIKVVAKDGSVSDYFNGALNYAPPFTIPARASRA